MVRLGERKDEPARTLASYLARRNRREVYR